MYDTLKTAYLRLDGERGVKTDRGSGYGVKNMEGIPADRWNKDDTVSSARWSQPHQ